MALGHAVFLAPSEVQLSDSWDAIGAPPIHRHGFNRADGDDLSCGVVGAIDFDGIPYQFVGDFLNVFVLGTDARNVFVVHTAV